MRKLLRKYSQQQPTLQELINAMSHSEKELFQKFSQNHVEPDQYEVNPPLPVPDHIPRPDWLNNPNPVYARPIEDGIQLYEQE